MMAAAVRLLAALLLMPPFAFAFKGIPVTQHRYPFDGFGNNEQDPSRGAADTPRVRRVPSGAAFLDAQGIPLNEENSGLPSARRVVEDLFRYPVAAPLEEERRCEVMITFGMLISIDLMGKADNTSEPFDIPCDGNLNDVLFCPATGQRYCSANETASIAAFRSQHELVSGPGFDTPVRATINKRTSFLDMEFIYGRDKESSDKIRTFEAGQLDLVDTGSGLLPRDPTLRAEFDITPGAYALIVVFMRFHNYVAKYTMEENPDFTEEEVFQSSRNYVIGTYQKIIAINYVSGLLGTTLGPYGGYDPNIDPSVDEFFAAVSYRYAHTEQPNLVRLVDKDYVGTSADPLFLRDVFDGAGSNSPSSLVEKVAGGIENVVRGMTTTPLKPYDSYFVDDLNIWTDTSVLDIQRPRDAGIPLYNNARRQMGLEPVGSIEELVTGEASDPPQALPYRNNDPSESSELVTILQNLYGNDIENVDAAVGALFENPADSTIGIFGPLFTMSFTDQFNRVRLGDRFWYENVFTEKERSEMLTLTEIIKLVCDGMEKFPWDAFSVWGIDKDDDDGSCDAVQTNQISLLGGEMGMNWVIENAPERDDEGFEAGQRRSIDLTLTANEFMEGAGFLGVGWRSRAMNGADIWFCRVNPTEYGQFPRPFPGNCDARLAIPEMFSCCVARGSNVVPSCLNPDSSGFYELEILSWCLSTGSASVTVRASVCDDDEGNNGCFELGSNEDGMIDVIAAFNPSAQNTPHGFQRRTSSVVDLKAGILTAAESAVADDGLIAYHAVTMMTFWMILAPIGIFIARYMKTRTWRLVAHISIMGVVGGLMIPILIGVEFAVGATDKSQEHAVVGLGLTFIILPMFIAGRIRYSKLQGNPVGRRTAMVAFMFHKFSGYAILIFAWWNCYTGLVRISPADSYLQLVVLSSFPFGYDLPIFGFILKHIYWPYLTIVCLIFLAAEVRRKRLNGSIHVRKLEDVKTGKSLWDDSEDADDVYDPMTMGKFLELTRLGSSLCIIDGRVLDISGFMDHHPGGREMLLTVPGSDITDEVVGLRDIEGFKHAHSYFALQKMKTLVIAVLVGTDGPNESDSIVELSQHLRTGNGDPSMDTENPKTPLGVSLMPVFRRGRILDVRFITPYNEISETNKPVVLLRLGIPRIRRSVSKEEDTILPSSCFKFRVVNPWGSTFEAYYTPVKLLRSGGAQGSENVDEEAYDFVISLRPGGQISKASLGWKVGKALAVQGPSVNPAVLESIASINRSTIVTMFASGTGIAPMLQLIDYYSTPSRVESAPNLFLVWVLKAPEHNYGEWIGLEAKAKRMRGKFKWITVYSSSKKKGQGKSKLTSKRVSIYDEVVKGNKKPSSSRRSRTSLSNPVESDERKSIKGTRASSVFTPSTGQGFRFFRGNRGRLIDSIYHQDPRVFANRTETVNFQVPPVSDGDFWLVANRSMTFQLDQSFVSDLITSIQRYCENEDESGAFTNGARKAQTVSRDDLPSPSSGSSRYIDVPGRYKNEDAFGATKTDREEIANGKGKEVTLAKGVALAFEDSTEDLHAEATDMMFYVCGSPRFDGDIRDWLAMKGFTNDRILNFYASPTVQI